MAIEDWSSTAANNALTLGVNIGENCPAANMNNALRQAMADVAAGVNFSVLGDFLASTSLSQARSTLGVASPTSGTSLTNLGNLTNAANKVPYMTGSDNWSTTDFTSFGRSVVATGDATALNTLLGSLATTGSSFSAGGGYVKLNIAGTIFKIMWGSNTVAANSATTITYPTAFSTFSVAVISAVGDIDPDAQHNPAAVTSCGTSSFAVYSASNTAVSGFWIAVGV